MIKKILVFIGLFISILVIWEVYNSIYKINPAIKESGQEVKTTINKKVESQIKDKDISYTEPYFENLSEIESEVSDATLQKTETALSSVSNDIEDTGMPTPDELYDQQISSTADITQKQDELPSTIPDIEVIPAELQEIEKAILQGASEEDLDLTYEEPLRDNPDQPYIPENLAELPASEDYETVIPFELQQLEQDYDAGLLKQELSTSMAMSYDSPEALETSEPNTLYDEPPIESELDADYELLNLN